jgi:protein RecA
MSQALRKLSGAIKQSNTALLFTNQLRMKIGVMFGNPETTTGGNALKFYASIRLDIRRIASIKDRDEVVGNRVRVKVAKNKMAPPFKSVNSTSTTTRGSREAERSSTSPSIRTSWRSREPGSPTRPSDWARAGRPRVSS